jgi:hypothetical protein
MSKKWDTSIIIKGIKDEDFDESLTKIEIFIRSLGYKVEFGVGEQSEGEED